MNMSQEQLEFKKFVETNAPKVAALFDWEKREVIFSRVDNYLEFASSAEDMLTRFLVGVWLHDNKYGFDMISAAKRLDPRYLHIIYKWLNKPIWP